MMFIVAVILGLVVYGFLSKDRRSIQVPLSTFNVIAKLRNAQLSKEPDQAKLLSLDGLPNYNRVILPRKMLVIYAVLCGSAGGCVGFIFYKQPIMVLVGALLGLLYIRHLRRQLIHKRKAELRQQFKQLLHALAHSLSAGHSLENALTAALQDLKFIYASSVDMITELEIIIRKLSNGEPIEKAFQSFSDRADLAEITRFSEVLRISRRIGGDLIDVVRRSAHYISETMEVEQEITVMLAKKKFESNIMQVVPFIIVAFLTLGSPDYMQPLYSAAGGVIMTVCLALLLLGMWISNNIMTIKV